MGASAVLATACAVPILFRSPRAVCTARLITLADTGRDLPIPDEFLARALPDAWHTIELPALPSPSATAMPVDVVLHCTDGLHTVRTRTAIDVWADLPAVAEVLHRHNDLGAFVGTYVINQTDVVVENVPAMSGIGAGGQL